MEQLDEEFYNQSAEYLETPHAIEVSTAEVEQFWLNYRAAFHVVPTHGVASITTYAAPAFNVLDEDGKESRFEDDGWRFTETVIFKDGDIWLRWHQKHSGELLEVCVRRGASK